MNPGQEHTTERPALDVFDAAWELAAKKGRCDERGGAEYRRIRGEWDRMMGKLLALDFILQRANEPPRPNFPAST